MAQIDQKDADMPWHTVALDKAILGLMKAGNALSFAAQTSGGTAGRDDHLCLAIIHWETELDKVKQVRRIVRLEWDEPEIGAGILALDPQAIAKETPDAD